MATLRGEAVDRPPVCFYEINGLDEDPTNKDKFNIYNHPSWAPLIELAQEKTDRIVMRGVSFKNTPPNPRAEPTTVETTYDAKGRRITTSTIHAGKHILTSRTRQDPEVNTVWTVEPLLKNVEDFKAWLDLPESEFGGAVDDTSILKAEKGLGDTGIVMIDTGDPLCNVAPLFSMEVFMVVAMTETRLFHRALEKAARYIHQKTEAVARALPGRLWRICGPEYASPPYLPPYLFNEYVVRYDTPMVEAIHRYRGFARIHSHGNLKKILDEIVNTGCMGLDPIEPPPQGDVTLAYVRKNYGRDLVLFGNLEASDIENLKTPEFAKKVWTALREGTAGPGRGFVLMPSACPYGRELSPLALRNYQAIIKVLEEFGASRKP